METAGLKIVRERCENIRWKGMFVDVQADPEAEAESREHIYWCVKTQTILGPDGQTVDEDICSPSRSCYRAL
ncbi:MAG: hypothetical protein HY238_16955 [Acidobacteria bacterium]|nr:hypothetical protein [Acidobacteriota bacterium]